MSDAPLHSLAARLLKKLSDGIYFHRGWFLYPQVALVGLCLWYTITHLGFKSDRSSLVGADKPYHKLFLEMRKEFPAQDDLVVVVESEDVEKNRQFVERLGAYLEAETNLFSGLFFRRDLTVLGRKALLFASTNDLVGLRDQLKSYAPILNQFAQATNLANLFNEVNRQFRTARRDSAGQGEQLVKALPAFTRIVSLATDSLRRVGDPPSPGVTSLFEGGKETESRMHITMAGGRIFLLVVKPLKDELSGKAIAKMRELINKTQIEVAGLNVGLTGETVLELDEMLQSQEDTALATIISFIAVALIFIYGYHETGRPLKATVCLLVGLVYSLGFTTLTVGHLNILTVTFFPILIGLAIDFGVHLITRYEEELRRGRSEQIALEKAIVNTGVGIFTGAFTTAGAFFAMVLTDFQGIREMGIICGGGLLVSLVPMMTLLPVLLLRGTQNQIDHEKGPVLRQEEAEEFDRRAKLEQIWLKRPLTVGLITLAITVVAWQKSQTVRFDYNLLNMQSEGLAAVIVQDKLIESSTRSLLYGAVIARTAEEAVRLQAELEKLPAVGNVESIVGQLQEDATPKLPYIHEVRELLKDVQFPAPDPRPANVMELNQILYSLHGYLGMAMEATEKDRPEIHRELMLLRQSVGDLLAEMRKGDRNRVAERLGRYQQALLEDVRHTFGILRDQEDQQTRLSVADLPASLRERFVGVHGKYLLQVYPKENIWERKHQEEFVRQLRQVVPQVTGTPVQLLEYTTLLRDSFVQSAYYSLGAIAILVLIHFRQWVCLVLALVPVFVGAVWMTGVMGWLNVPFNPANIMTLPLLVGIGVTNGIHILNRYAEENNPSILARSTGKAVLVSGLTTIAGFGSLILAKHRGISSLGLIMSVGVATCMFVGLTFLPVLLNLLERVGWSIRKNPV